MAVVEVRFSALPAHVRTARLVVSAVARRCGVAEELLDEVRFAVGEACARAVDLHRRFAPQDAVVLELADGVGRFGVTVIDAAPSGAEVTDIAAGEIGSGIFDPASIADAVPRQPDGTSSDPTLDFLPAGFGLAVIRGLVDDVDIASAGGGSGTTVRMSWPVASQPLRG